jgi:hypothetical protein
VEETEHRVEGNKHNLNSASGHGDEINCKETERVGTKLNGVNASELPFEEAQKCSDWNFLFEAVGGSLIPNIELPAR